MSSYLSIFPQVSSPKQLCPHFYIQVINSFVTTSVQWL